jgi:hypothetical protein
VLRFLGGTLLRGPLCRIASFLLGLTRFRFDLALPLGSSASLLFGAVLRFLGGTLLRGPLCRIASFLLGLTRFRFDLALPLGSRTSLYFSAVLGKALPRRCGACFFFRAALRLFCLMSLRLPLRRNAGSFRGAAASRAHHKRKNRDREHKTDPADDEWHLHGLEVLVLSIRLRRSISPCYLGACCPTESVNGFAACLPTLPRRPTLGQSAFSEQHAHWGVRGRQVRCP